MSGNALITQENFQTFNFDYDKISKFCNNVVAPQSRVEYLGWVIQKNEEELFRNELIWLAMRAKEYFRTYRTKAPNKSYLKLKDISKRTHKIRIENDKIRMGEAKEFVMSYDIEELKADLANQDFIEKYGYGDEVRKTRRGAIEIKEHSIIYRNRLVDFFSTISLCMPENKLSLSTIYPDKSNNIFTLYMDLFHEIKRAQTKELKKFYYITFLFGESIWFKIQKYSKILKIEDKMEYFEWLLRISYEYPFNEMFDKHEIYPEYFDAEYQTALRSRYLMTLDDEPKVNEQLSETSLEIEPIKWLQSERQFAWLIEQLAAQGYISKDKKWTLAASHIVNKEGKPFNANSLNSKAAEFRECKEKELPLPNQRIQDIVKKIPSEKS